MTGDGTKCREALGINRGVQCCEPETLGLGIFIYIYLHGNSLNLILFDCTGKASNRQIIIMMKGVPATSETQKYLGFTKIHFSR